MAPSGFSLTKSLFGTFLNEFNIETTKLNFRHMPFFLFFFFFFFPIDDVFFNRNWIEA